MDENQEMKRFADRLWEYFKPKIEELTRSNVWYFRAQVTKPALDGKSRCNVRSMGKLRSRM